MFSNRYFWCFSSSILIILSLGDGLAIDEDDCLDFQVSECRLPWIHFYCKLDKHKRTLKDDYCEVCRSREGIRHRNCRSETEGKKRCDSLKDCKADEMCCLDHCIDEKICIPVYDF